MQPLNGLSPDAVMAELAVRHGFRNDANHRSTRTRRNRWQRRHGSSRHAIDDN